MSEPESGLNNGEQVIATYKPSRKSSLITSYIGAVAIGLGSLLFMVVEPSTGLMGLLVAAGMIVSPEVLVRGSKFYVTNQRVIKEFKFLVVRNKMVEYDRITHVNPRLGIIDRFLGAGTVRIKTAGTFTTEFKLKHIQGHKEASQTISNQMHQAGAGNAATGGANNNAPRG